MCSIDWGLVVSALAAIGSIGAAVIALYIATTDRRERRRERDAEDEAQAKLVIVLPRRPTNPLELQVQVTNLGTKALIDVTFVEMTVEGHDLGDLQPTIGPFPVFTTPGNYSLFTFGPDSYGQTHPYYIAVRGGPNNEPQTITETTQLRATVRWTDASGKTWERSGSAPADGSRVDLTSPVRISA